MDRLGLPRNVAGTGGVRSPQRYAVAATRILGRPTGLLVSVGRSGPEYEPANTKRTFCGWASGLAEVGQVLPMSESVSFCLRQTYQLALVEPDLVWIEAEEFLAGAVIE